MEEALTNCRAEVVATRKVKLDNTVEATSGSHKNAELLRLMAELEKMAASAFAESGPASAFVSGYFSTLDAWEEYSSVNKDASPPPQMDLFTKCFVTFTSVQTLTRPLEGYDRAHWVKILVKEAFNADQLLAVPDPLYAVLAKAWNGLTPR